MQLSDGYKGKVVFGFFHETCEGYHGNGYARLIFTLNWSIPEIEIISIRNSTPDLTVHKIIDIITFKLNSVTNLQAIIAKTAFILRGPISNQKKVKGIGHW